VEEEDGDEQENKVTAREPTRRDRQVMQQRRVGSFGTEAMDWESAAGGKQLGASVWWDAPAVKRTSQRILAARGGGTRTRTKLTETPCRNRFLLQLLSVFHALQTGDTGQYLMRRVLLHPA
jgi:hypothetical protein